MWHQKLTAADLLDHAGGKAASQPVLLSKAGAWRTNMAVLRGNKAACATVSGQLRSVERSAAVHWGLQPTDSREGLLRV